MESPRPLLPQLEFYWSLFLQDKISKGDVVGLFLIIYDQLFPVKNWLQYSPSRMHSTGILNSFFYPKQSQHFENHPFFKKNAIDQTLGNIFNHCLFKKETLRSALGLIHIFNQPNTIQILDYIPTPLQVLEMQSRGFRCVTLLRTPNWFNHTFEHKRNLRDFVIHDLEHIWQLFESPKISQAQIKFSKKLLELTRKGYFIFLQTDPDLSKEFDYIISDMNTHPAHTYATLKSLITRKKLRSAEMGKLRLDSVQENEISDIMQHFDGLVTTI